MREAHAHIAALGQALTLASMEGCQSPSECLERVRRACAEPDSGGWVRMHSARIESWNPPRWPTIDELDAVAGGHPCVIMSFDHHAAMANTAALGAAGLSVGQAVPPKGHVCVDSATGQPTGLLLEHAAYKAWDSAPEPSPAERVIHIERALQLLANLGFEEVHDLHSQPWLGPALAGLQAAGRMPMRRVLLYPALHNLESVASTSASWATDRLRLAGGKVFADGTLNSRTALMLEPYREPLHAQPRGVAMVSDDALDQALRMTEALGLHLAVHAIGDGAVRMVLDAIDRTSPVDRGPGRRHRIEHAELIEVEDVPRFAKLGVVCSVQPCHLLADIEVLTRQLPHRLHRVLPLAELIASGCVPGGEDGLLWFGSDVPIVRADPTDSLHAAINRRRPGEPLSSAIAWEQRISREHAEAAFAGTCL